MSLDLTAYGLPEGADLAALQGRVATPLGNGVTNYSGHDQYGLAFRFFVYDNYNQLKSKAAKCELFDQVEMIEIFVDKKTRLHKMVTDKIRYRYPEEYKRFREGREAPGTPLDKWGVIPSNEIQTLVKDGIFTVEQFALQSADKVQGRYPAVFFEHFERAQQFVASKTGNVQVEKVASELIELQRGYAALQAQLAEMAAEKEQILATKSGKAAPKKKAAKGKIITDKDFE